MQYYNEKSNDDINDFNNIKENIKHIFDKVQFMNSELLFEIIEEFVDHDNLYKSFIDYILQRNFEKINELFFNSSSAKKEKKSNLIEKALKELFEANKLADICIGLLNKFDLSSVFVRKCPILLKIFLFNDLIASELTFF